MNSKVGFDRLSEIDLLLLYDEAYGPDNPYRLHEEGCVDKESGDDDKNKSIPLYRRSLVFVNKFTLKALGNYNRRFVPNYLKINISLNNPDWKKLWPKDFENNTLIKMLKFPQYIHILSIQSCKLYNAYPEKFLNKHKWLEKIELIDCDITIALLYRVVRSKVLNKLVFRRVNIKPISSYKCQVLDYQRISIRRNKSYKNIDPLSFLFYRLHGFKIKKMILDEMVLSKGCFKAIAGISSLEKLVISNPKKMNLNWLSANLTQMNLSYLKISLESQKEEKMLYFFDEMINKPIEVLEIQFWSAIDLLNLDIDLLTCLYSYIFQSAQTVIFFDCIFDDQALNRLASQHYICKNIVFKTLPCRLSNLEVISLQDSFNSFTLDGSTGAIHYHNIEEAFSSSIPRVCIENVDCLSTLPLNIEYAVTDISIIYCKNFSLKNLIYDFSGIDSVESLSIHLEKVEDDLYLSQLISGLLLSGNKSLQKLEIQIDDPGDFLEIPKGDAIYFKWIQWYGIEILISNNKVEIEIDTERKYAENFACKWMEWEKETSLFVQCKRLNFDNVSRMETLLSQLNLESIEFVDMQHFERSCVSTYEIASLYQKLFSKAKTVILNGSALNMDAIRYFDDLEIEDDFHKKNKGKGNHLCSKLIISNLDINAEDLIPLKKFINPKILVDSSTCSIDPEYLRPRTIEKYEKWSANILNLDVDYAVFSNNTRLFIPSQPFICTVPNVCIELCEWIDICELKKIFSSKSTVKRLGITYDRNIEYEDLYRLIHSIDELFNTVLNDLECSMTVQLAGVNATIIENMNYYEWDLQYCAIDHWVSNIENSTLLFLVLDFYRL